MKTLDDWDIQPDIIATQDLTLEQCLAAGSKGVMISNENYHGIGGISGSNLTLLAESNKHLDNKQLFNLGESPALTFGTLLHTMVLEPHDIPNCYAILPELNLRTNQGKADKEAFIESSKGKTVVTMENFEKARDMSRNVMAICGDVIESAIKERSLFVDLDGLILKSRLDADAEEDGDDFDLKSITLGTKGFSDRTLEQHIKKLGYHRSAAFRNIIRRALGKPVRDSYLIFCDTGPGNMVRVIKIHQDWIKQAESEVNDLLEDRRFYLSSGVDNYATVIDDTYRNSTY